MISAPLSLRRELLVVGTSLAACPVVAALEPGSRQAAVSRARWLADAQGRLGVAIEGPVQSWFEQWPALLAAATVVYYGAHLPVLFGVGCVLGVRRPDVYRTARSTFVAAQLMTILSYLLLPTAPPRLMDGPLPASSALHSLQYEYAALPSGHVVFALVVGVALARCRGWMRLGILYPLVIGVVVLATGDHLLFDVVAAIGVVVVAGAAVAVVGAVRARPAGLRAPASPALS